MTSAPFSSLFYANRGNISDKWEQYLAIYEAELRPWHGKPVDLLEIGVQNGGSMQVWAGYFDPASKLVGLDIDARITELPHAPNVELFVADGTDEAQIVAALGERTFDIIIDDGSHFSSDMANSFRLLFPRLNPGGRYFIEDLHCAYWGEFGGGLARPESAIEFLKTFVDVLHFDHLEHLDELHVDVDGELLLDLRKGLGKVTFYDSVAVVERLPFVKLGPYRRVLAGDEGSVVDPMDLMTLEEPGRLLFAKPLARKLESGLLRTFEQMQDIKARNDQLQFESESLLEQLAAERANAAAVDADRQRLDAVARRAEAKVEHQRALAIVAEAANAQAMRSLGSSLQTSARSKLNAEAAAEAAAGELAATLGRLHDLQRRLDETSARVENFGDAVVSLRNQVSAIERSFTHRLMGPVRLAARLARRARRELSVPTPEGGDAHYEQGGQPSKPATLASVGTAVRGKADGDSRRARADAYELWRERYGTLSAADRRLIDNQIATADLPALVVLVRVDVDDVAQIESAFAALAAQRMPAWHAWISIAAANRTDAVVKTVAKQVRRDERMHLVEPDALGEVPVGNVVVVLTASSTILSEHALYLFSEATTRGKRFAYGDAEMVDPEHKALLPSFKPALSPLHQNLHKYIGNTVAIDNRGSSLDLELIEFAAGITDIASVIRTAISTIPPAAVERIPFVLQCDTWTAPVAAPAELAANSDIQVRVSVIIPTRDRLELLEPCIDSLLADTKYPRELIEIIVVDNGSTEYQTVEYLRRRSRRGDVVVMRDDGDFNYPRLNNIAAAAATGDVLVLLNNDTTVFDPDWLGTMVAYAIEPGIGAVGAKLLYPDLSVQHGGVVLGIQGVAAHVNHMLPYDHEAYNEAADFTHEVAAVTGACLAIRADVYREVGGLDESLAVTFNDIDLCCATLSQGYRNVYIGSPLIIHHESKSRGYNIKPEQHEAFRREAIRARTKFPDLYRDDPYYNPNFSLATTYELAEPPRGVRPWMLFHRRAQTSRCILMLSSTHQIGHGVAVVIDMQARHLAALGHRVILGGPRSDNDFAYRGCERVILRDEVDAAKFAFECGADVVMMHTPPFFATARWLGTEQTKIAYDYGEPNPDHFPDAEGRRGVLADKRFSMALADARFAISETVRAESGFADMGVISLGNGHLATWGSEHEAARDSVRQLHGWTDKLVVFNVCRFHGAERNYKGVDAYAALLQVMKTFAPTLAAKVVFVLCGKASEQDVREMEACGLVVFSNVTDPEMVELYAAADVYVNLSKWEGYNLGIGQALAMGLPTLASDIPAHRAFEVTTTDDMVEQVSFLQKQAAALASPTPSERRPRIWSWEASLDQLAQLISET